MLRLTDTGRPPEFLVTRNTDDGEKYSINPEYIARYFLYQPFGSKRMMPRNPSPRFFGKSRDTDTVRVVVLGESTTQGYPHPNRLAFPALAERMLSIRHPDRRFEIINAGVVALNSFAVLDIGRHFLNEIHPDVVVVYSGHNEFHGIFGSATTSHFLPYSAVFARCLPMLWSTNTFTLLERVIHRTSKYFAPAVDTAVPMEVMAKDRYVRPGDDAHRRARENFRTNLMNLIREAGRTGTPVILILPVSNIMDQPPMASLDRHGQPVYDRDRIRTLEALLALGDYEGVLRHARTLVQTDNRVALWHYYMGVALARTGRMQAATDELTMSRELDALQFRSSQEITDVIASFATPANRPPGSSVRVVDPSPAFRQLSPGGIPGCVLFYEHVHPTFMGNLVLAWSSVQGIESVKGLQSHVPDFPAEIYMKQIIQTEVDRYVAASKVGILLSEWPFADRDEMEGLRILSRQNIRESRERMDAVCLGIIASTRQNLMRMDEVIYYTHIGRAYMEGKMPMKAIFYLETAFREAPDEPDVALHLGIAWLMVNDPSRAIQYLQRADRMEPNNPVTNTNIGMAYLRMKYIEEAGHAFRMAMIQDPSMSDARVGMALVQMAKGDIPGARREIDFLLNIHPTHHQARELLRIINSAVP